MPIPLTLLTITPLAGSGTLLSPYSARGLTQSLDPIIDNPMGNQIFRTINGGMLDMTYDQFRKYKSVISCSDHDAPAFDGLKQGDIVVVDCCKELCYQAGGSPTRTVISGSLREQEGYYFYLPRLTMMVTRFTPGSFSEWEARTTWSLELEEI